MLHVAHHARLHVVDKDGISARAHAEAGARRGDKVSLALLEAPPIHPAMEPLRDLLFRWHGKNGVGQHGLNPLTHGAVLDMMRATQTPLEPHEIDALVDLDAILCFPPKDGVQ